MNNIALLGICGRKSHLWSFCLIIVYAVYAFFINNPTIEDEVLLLESPNIPYFIFIPIALLIICLAFWGQHKGKWTSSDIGIKLSKIFWITFGISIVLLIPTVVNYTQVYTAYSFIHILQLLLFIVGSELILRVLLINRLENIFNNPNWLPVPVAVFSGIVFVAVHLPMGDITYTMILGSTLLSLIYIHSRSFLIVLFADLTLYTNVQYALIMALLVISFYFALVFIGKFLEKRNTASVQIE